ncbi:sugar-phosphatase [Clostridium sp. HBUAS56017]|uniref:sugar-phosphatase n=1 Tax=Clostridium sp. HBUAS56017 TaxID=2571128 RepID=UPI0011777C83|nr:sugar-phosphatase [Clostridium sp. HBUAS56017]
MYKIIALDMDGTLLNDEKVITDKTKNALIEARKKGVKVVLASGRPVDGLKRYLNELELVEDNEFVLSYNGCLVQKTKGEEIICEVGLTGKDLHYAYELSRQLGVNIHAFSPTRGLITPKVSKYTEVEANINDIDIRVCDFNTIEEDEHIVKIMFIDEPEILDKAIASLPSEIYERYNVVKSTPYFLEIINKESGKGVGLKALADYLDIPSKEIIAVGDAGNDLDMIEFAGLGVAMGNATEKIKEIADYITGKNTEDGVLEVVEKFILND